MTTTRPARRTQAERSRASRAKIIRAASDYFARQGFHGARMADIARAAGLTEPGLLHHFSSKTRLLMAVLEERDRIDKERSRATLQQEGSHFLDMVGELVAHNETVPGLVQLFTVLVAESLSPQHPAHEFFVQRYQRERDAMTEAIAQAQAAGEIRADLPAETLTVLLFALMDGLQVQWLLEPKEVSMAALFQSARRLLETPGR